MKDLIGSLYFFISSKKLNNLLIVLDRNNLLTLGSTESIIKMESLKKKFESFNFQVLEINGHNYEQLEKSFKKFSNAKNQLKTNNYDL